MVESNIIQAFVDGIRALVSNWIWSEASHALEVEAVRQDIRSIYKLREVSEEGKDVKKKVSKEAKEFKGHVMRRKRTPATEMPIKELTEGVRKWRNV